MMETIQCAILGGCLCLCVAALAAVAIVLILIVYKRIGKRDDQVALEIAQRLIASWDAGAATRQNILANAELAERVKTQRRRANQQWNPGADAAEQARQGPPESVTLGVFGDSPMPPDGEGFE